MRTYSLGHLSDRDLLRDLHTVVARDRTMTTEVLAHIAEVDARRLYLPAGYPSMHAYCVHELHFSEDAALKRIRAGRAARQFPAIFDALADGRLHLSAVVLLKPYLTSENADELLKAAAHQTKAEIEQLLAQRFPRSELLPMVEPIPASSLRNDRLAEGRDEEFADGVRNRVGESTDQLAPGPVENSSPHSSVKPHARGRYALHLTIAQDAYDQLEYAQALLSHSIPSGDLAKVLERLIAIAIPQVEKRRFAATEKPRPRQRRSCANPRSVPAHVKRAVWQRDRGQCTFVGEGGHRCASRKFLELDHVDPVARGGHATVERMRLRCRAHNQYEAERSFGAGFIAEKREESRRAAAAARAAAKGGAGAMAAGQSEARAGADEAEARTRTTEAEARAWADEAEARVRADEAEAQARSAAQEQAMDVMAGLRQLGFRADEARRATEFSETIASATLEERMRAALKFLGPKPRFQGRVETSLGMAT